MARPFLILHGLLQCFAKAKSVYGKRLLVAALLVLMFSGVASADRRSYVDYDELPNFNTGEMFIPQVDWFMLVVLIIVLVVAIRIMQRLGLGPFGGGY